MTSGRLQCVRIAILVSEGYEELELLEPKRTLERSGAAMFVIAPKHDRVEGIDRGKRKQSVPVDVSLTSAKPEDFHALLLLGGNENAEHLEANPEAMEFVQGFLRGHKVVAAVGEGIQVLGRIGALRGRMVAASDSLQEELVNGAAIAVDEGVVCDGNLITARSMSDTPALEREMIRVLANLREHAPQIRRLA